ncbi:MAG TPA: ABC transporter permease [Opitutaceae bacterium]|nr:ABC transporter permease [Opitutaceae bacterium]
MKRLIYEFNESVRIAFAQIRANKMRSALTALGVIIGIVAVTLMGTAINGIGAGVKKSLSGFGDDVLFVGKWPWTGTNEWWIYRNRREIKPSYAAQINEYIAATPNTFLKLAVPVAQRESTIVRNGARLDHIWTMGTVAEYSQTAKSDLREGRFFSDFEVQAGKNVIFIGFDVADALFPNEDPVGQTLRVKGQPFEVIGVAARQGSFLGLWSWDSMIALPITTYRRYFTTKEDAEIRVQFRADRPDEARDELRGLMRRIRQLDPEVRDDFEINSQSTLGDQLGKIQFFIGVAGMIITSLALLVGAIGIMNITYVSVKERTREIGTRKALGARRRTILLQFLIEAVAICIVGGVIGISFTLGIATVIGMAFPAFPVVYSFGLIALGLGLSMATGVLSGFLPAVSASKLDPVIALRYE